MAISVTAVDFDTIYEEWIGLLPNSVTNNIFVTPWWQKTWWDAFGNDSELIILAVRDSNRLLGIAPMQIKKGALSFIGDTNLFDYHDFLVLRDFCDYFYQALFDSVMGFEWEVMCLTSLPDDSPTLQQIPRLSKSNSLHVKVSEEDKAPLVNLPSSWEEYLAGLKKRNRHELRRKFRRLEKYNGIREYVYDTHDLVPDGMNDFFRLMRLSRSSKEEFLTVENEQFFSAIANKLTSLGFFKLHFLEVDNKRVASCICFDYGGAYLLYNSGYDPNYSSLSVGLINKATAVREAITRGKRRFEFLRGSERYKYDLGGEDKLLYEITVRR